MSEAINQIELLLPVNNDPEPVQIDVAPESASSAAGPSSAPETVTPAAAPTSSAQQKS